MNNHTIKKPPVMHLSGPDTRPVTSRLLRLPLRWLRPGMVLPVLSGPLRGRRWIVGSGPHSCWLGTYEREKQALFAKTISPNSTVFDIGAGVGFYSLLAARRSGAGGQVFAFEPLAQNLNYLRMHLALNKARNVSVIEAAVSYKNGFAPLDEVPGLEGTPLSSGEALRVRTCTLDQLHEQGQIPLPDVLRMDIRGGEFAALSGAKNLLSRAGPTLFLSLYGDGPRREACAFLDLLGYRLAPMDGEPLEQSGEILATRF